MRQKNIRFFAYFTVILLATVLNGLFSQIGASLISASAQDQLWQEIATDSINALRSDQQPRLAPQRYRAFQLNEAALASVLANAPMELTEAAKTTQNEITLPMPDGKFARFRFVESPILSPELAAQFPEIKTYGGWGVDDPRTTVRFDRTSGGFHAIVFSPEGAVYIYPLFNGDRQTYASFYAHDAGVERSVGCLVGSVDPALTKPSDSPRRQLLRRSTANILSNGSTLRTFRLAVGATAEYTNFFGGTTGGAMNNGIVPAINAVNGIYRNELAISLNLVAALIYTNASTDPYTSGNLGQLLGQNQNNLDNVVGEDNFDIGHVFDAPPAPGGAIAGGGLATIGVVCNNGDEGRGASGLSVPTPGFPAFFELIVAHEIGHQFGADHSFNGTVGNCGNAGQRNGDTAWEPGSGSTLMAYPGICGSDNVEQNPGTPQPLNDSYFHGRSLKQIVEYLDKCGGCETTSSTNNTPPSITLPDSGFYIIPAQTPFTLRATATDAEDAFLSYCWEQTDLGSAGPPNGDRGDNPLFRSWLPNGSPSRTFPRMADLLNGTTVIGETLPATTRTLHFDLTVRDNHLSGGGYNQTFAVVNVATVSDLQDPPGALTVSASAPAGITVSTTNTNGVITATAAASCGVAPGTYTATLTVRDSDSMTTSASLPVIVDPNPPPTMGNYNNTGVTVGGSVTVVPNAPPSDPNNALTLSVTPVALPGGGLLSVNQANGHVTVSTVPNTALGVYLVKVTVKDACGAVVTRGFNLTVRSATCATEQMLIFAADTGNHRIQRFNGVSWKDFGTFGSGPGQFNSPEAVVASGDGRKIYVADTGNRRIQWSQDGGVTWAIFATSVVPQGLALDRDGNIYASDALDSRVVRYAGGVPGKPVTLATGGSGAGRVSNPNGLAIDCRMNLYIADTGNNRILVIATADATMIANTGTVVAGPGAGVNPAQVTAPQGVAVDNAGKLYVADTGNDRVLLITSAPAPGAATVLCTLGPQLGQVRDAEGVTIAAFTSGALAGASSLIVSDTANNRIQGAKLPAGSWMLLPPPAGGGAGSGTGQFKLPSKLR